MRGVSIIGIGSTSFGKHKNISIKELAIKASLDALADAGVSRKDVEAFYLGNFVSGLLARQETLAGHIAASLGLKGIPATKVEGACSSSSIGLRNGYMLIASGLADFILVTGVEKMTAASTDKVTESLALALDRESEGRCGLTFPGFFALLMRRHLYDHDTKLEQFAQVSVKNHRNGVKNPRAQFRREVTVEEVLDSRMIADPVKLLECCPVSDGAASVVICPSEIAKKYTDTPIDIVASTQAVGTGSTYEIFSGGQPTTLYATVWAANQAYKMAKLEPNDIDIVELHDCFSPAEIIDSEDLGFFKKGEGGKAVEEGITEVDGKKPINPSGGLLSKGHPVGATGTGQVFEAALQLRGQAENQVKGAEVALTHNMGGPATVCTVHILKRR